MYQRAISDLHLSVPMKQIEVTAALNEREQKWVTPAGLPYIIPPDTPYGARWRDGALVLSVCVRRHLIAEVASELFERSVQPFEIIPAFGVKDRSISLLLRSLEEALYEPKGCANVKVAYISRALVADVLRKYSARSQERPIAESKPKLRPKQAKLVIDYIQQQLPYKILMPDLAALTGLSQTAFIQRFRASFGLSPHRYVTEARINQAKGLLGESHLPIIDVAMRCGFSDQAHFTTTFKRLVGVPPARYRLTI